MLGYDLPPLDTIHKFSRKHYDKEFINRSLAILEKHLLRPIDRDSWYRACWHSNYGYCLDNNDRIVFAKIFRSELLENYKMELEARNFLGKIDHAEIHIPRDLFSYPEDLCIVMEPVTGKSLSIYFNDYNHWKKLASLLLTNLVHLYRQTNSTPEKDANAWVSGRVQKYFYALSPYNKVLNKFPRFREVMSELSWVGQGKFSFALGDVTPTHIYWSEQSASLTFIDLELAGLKPAFYDFVYFCHRLVTRYTQFNPDWLYQIILELIFQLEQIVDPDNIVSFRNNLICLLGVRMVGGLVDSLVIGDGTRTITHRLAWNTYLKIQDTVLRKPLV